MIKNNDNSTKILDKIDRKLLYLLDVNARQSNIQLGKKLRISKDSVKYRIERLMRRGVITGFYTEMDAYKIGYFAFRMLIRLQNLTIEKEKGIINHLISDSRVAWVYNTEGDWDLLFGVWAKNIFEFYAYQEEFFTKYGNYIENKMVSIYHRMYQFKKDYIVGNERKIKRLQFMGGDKKTKIDDTDKKILVQLINNARTPLYEIAGKIGVSAKVVAYRVKKMIKAGIILNFRPMLDLGKLGLSWYKVHLYLKNIDAKVKKNLFSYTASLPNVVYIDEMIGGYDFEIDVDLESHEKLRDFVENLRKKFPMLIRDFEILDCYKAHKNLVWFPL